jgi:hypothetical protein
MIQVIKRHKGLGDTVEFLAEKTGIKYAVNKAVELGIIEDCGCEGRKQYLNEIMPYGNKGEDSEVLRSES